MRRLRCVPVLGALVGMLFGFLELTACPLPPEPPHVVVVADGGYPPGPREPTDDEDPPVELATFPICVQACATLKRLGCSEANRPDGGSTCYAVCAKSEQSGKFMLRPGCIVDAKTKSEARVCGTVRCGK